MRGIAGLGVETGIPLADHLPPGDLETGLGEPFRFVVCGEVNAGKSTLLNGLFGGDLCRANILPETDHFIFYRYGDPPRDDRITPVLEEKHRPVRFLRDFNLIDTPGMNAWTRAHQETTGSFIHSADLILVVFPVSNPWGAATWNFLSQLSAEALGKAVIVIQQSDQRQPQDLEVIRGHMRDLAMKRIGRVLPLFAVSGKLALEAKQTKPFSAERFKASGYPELEDFIARHVCGSPERKNALESWRAQAAAALRAVEDRIEEQTRELDRQGRFLEEIEQEIDDMRERFVQRLPRHLEGVAEVFETEAAWVGRILRRALGPLRSCFRLFVGDRTGLLMESLFIGRLQAAVEDVAEKDGAEVVETCRAHWLELADRVREKLGVELGGCGRLDETLELAKQRFVQRIGRSASQGIGNLKVRNRLDKELRRRNVALKSFCATTLALLTAGAICGALGLPWLPGILCAAAGLFFLGGTWVAWLTRKSISREFNERLLDTCGTFAGTLRTDYEEALRAVFKDYATALAVVREYLAREKIAIEPRLKRWQELFLTLKAIEQEL
jgi:hypothetical protein